MYANVGDECQNKTIVLFTKIIFFGASKPKTQCIGRKKKVGVLHPLV
jgi:hypothetical protein